MAQKSELIVGLDIGTTKISAVVGELTASGQMDIVGFGCHPSRGLRRGVVVDIEATVASIRQALAEAETMSGCALTHVYVGIAGGHIRGFNSHGIVALQAREVTRADVARVMDAARAVAIPDDREVLHILPQEYIIDAQEGIREPTGMSGVRLEAKVHIVTGAASSAQNILKCVQRAGVKVLDMVLEQLASSQAVLSHDERDLGVALVDIGGGTTDIAVWRDGSIVHTSVVPIAGDHITHDLAVGLRTPVEEAERVKCLYGTADPDAADAAEEIEVATVGGRRPRLVARARVAEIVQARLDEILGLVAQELDRCGHRDLMASGVVLTGGSTMLAGIDSVAEARLHLPVRLGTPLGIGGLVEVVQSPMHSTGVGLVLYGQSIEAPERSRAGSGNTYDKMKSRMRSWLGDFF